MAKISVRASELENSIMCDRYFRFLQDGEEPEWSEYVMRAFHDGTLHERAIVEYALGRYFGDGVEYDECKAQREGEIEVDGVVITGHADYVADDYDGKVAVIEAKFISIRAIQGIMSMERGHRYYLQVQSYLQMFGGDYGLLVMRNKNTPAGRMYDHYIKAIAPDYDALRDAVEVIKEYSRRRKFRGIEREESKWLCSSSWCPFYKKCEVASSAMAKAETVVNDEVELKELDELIELYKELIEENGYYETAKRDLRDRIVEKMERLKLNQRQTSNAFAELKVGYRKTLRKDVDIPDDWYQISEFKRLVIK